MTNESDNNQRIVIGADAREKVITFESAAPALSTQGKALAFGARATARSSGDWGQAFAFGEQSIADAATAVGAQASLGIAISRQLAVALGHMGVAVSDEIAISTNILGKAHGKSFAVSCGKGGVADGLIAISLGLDGQAIAREGGTIALAFYDQHPGHWESPHGCDPTWFDGEVYLSDLKVAKVGTNGIRANYRYRLDDDGSFLEVGPATERKRYDKPEGSL